MSLLGKQSNLAFIQDLVTRCGYVEAWAIMKRLELPELYKSIDHEHTPQCVFRIYDITKLVEPVPEHTIPNFQGDHRDKRSPLRFFGAKICPISHELPWDPSLIALTYDSSRIGLLVEADIIPYSTIPYHLKQVTLWNMIAPERATGFRWNPTYRCVEIFHTNRTLTIPGHILDATLAGRIFRGMYDPSVSVLRDFDEKSRRQRLEKLVEDGIDLKAYDTALISASDVTPSTDQYDMARLKTYLRCRANFQDFKDALREQEHDSAWATVADGENKSELELELSNRDLEFDILGVTTRMDLLHNSPIDCTHHDSRIPLRLCNMYLFVGCQPFGRACWLCYGPIGYALLKTSRILSEAELAGLGNITNKLPEFFWADGKVSFRPMPYWELHISDQALYRTEAGELLLQITGRWRPS